MCGCSFFPFLYVAAAMMISLSLSSLLISLYSCISWVITTRPRAVSGSFCTDVYLCLCSTTILLEVCRRVEMSAYDRFSSCGQRPFRRTRYQKARTRKNRQNINDRPCAWNVIYPVSTDAPRGMLWERRYAVQRHLEYALSACQMKKSKYVMITSQCWENNRYKEVIAGMVVSDEWRAVLFTFFIFTWKKKNTVKYRGL